MSDLKFTIKFCVILLFTLITYKPAIAQSAIAQSEERKIEVGAQFTVLDAGASFLRPISTAVGAGGRVTVDLSKSLALEGELNYFPANGNDARIFQGQFGLKGGWRFERFGVFGKVRPGFINTKYDFGRDCILGPCFGLVFIPSDTRASFDVGGVLEFYPFKQITVRFDAGDTIVNRSFGVHNLQVSTGIGYRF